MARADWRNTTTYNVSPPASKARTIFSFSSLSCYDELSSDNFFGVYFMAKNQGGSDDRAKVKFRVIEFELEGGNAAVENSVRNLTNAITQKNGTGSQGKPALSSNKTSAALPAAPAVSDVAD